MNQGSMQRVLRHNPYLFTLLLLVIAIYVNWQLQDNLFEQRVVDGNLRVPLPSMIVAVGQAIVIIGGGIDLSVGTMVYMINAILVSLMTPDAGTADIILIMAIACGAGMLAGAVNGFCVAYLRLQPIVTTYATGFVFAGIALAVLPTPPRSSPVPQDLQRFYARSYQSLPFDLPLSVYVIILMILFWFLLRSTRYGHYLFATGGQAQAAYTTGVPVPAVRFSTYVLSGLFCAFAAIALTLLTGTANASLALRDGGTLTLRSIVAVVLGGTRLSGGMGGITGPILAVMVLTFVDNSVSFADISTWYQDLVDAAILITALAAPGIVRLARTLLEPLLRGRQQEALT